MSRRDDIVPSDVVRERALAFGERFADERFGDLKEVATLLCEIIYYRPGAPYAYLLYMDPQGAKDLAITPGNIRRRRVSSVAPLLAVDSTTRVAPSCVIPPEPTEEEFDAAFLSQLLDCFQKMLRMKRVGVCDCVLSGVGVAT